MVPSHLASSRWLCRTTTNHRSTGTSHFHNTIFTLLTKYNHHQILSHGWCRRWFNNWSFRHPCSFLSARRTSRYRFSFVALCKSSGIDASAIFWCFDDSSRLLVPCFRWNGRLSAMRGCPQFQSYHLPLTSCRFWRTLCVRCRGPLVDRLSVFSSGYRQLTCRCPNSGQGSFQGRDEMVLHQLGPLGWAVRHPDVLPVQHPGFGYAQASRLSSGCGKGCGKGPRSKPREWREYDTRREE